MTSSFPANTERRLEPELVVIIPTYRHPVLLTEALDSVLDQIATVTYAIIVCSDGCAFPETDVSAFAFALADPRIVYLRQPNGGPSSARNFAIDWALANFPSMSAVFFLDSDNRLTPTALQAGYDALMESPGLGWVYSNIDSFGINWSANYAVPYSPLLHVVHDNICDTGSFVSRALLDAGVRFDENALSGYEDWDFWLQALQVGFRGKFAPFGFSYRQRPESRFREMNRMRGSILEHLRQRHWKIASPRNLIRWEHETNPRYLLIDPGERDHRAFTDPSDRYRRIESSSFEADLWASLSAGDEVWIPAFFVFGDAAAIDELLRRGLAHNIFLLMERAAGSGKFAALTVASVAGSISIEISESEHRTHLVRNAVLWLVSSRQSRNMLVDEDAAWMDAVASGAAVPNAVEVHLRAPAAANFGRVGSAALTSMLATLRTWRGSRYRNANPARWIWRPRRLPSRDEYYDKLCLYLGVIGLMPRVASGGLDVGFIVPFASYGGSEKVAYALAKILRRRGGIRTHLFVVGAAKMNIVPEYELAFDTMNFLADPEFPAWGGPSAVFGQNIFLPDAPELKLPQLGGLLGQLDLVFNCQSAPANSAMGSLRRQKVKTISYLHLTDFSPYGRPVGHPYLATGFEHAYDLIVTCSRRLADELHSLGIPGEKILPIANAASFGVSTRARQRARESRSTARGSRNLRCLYIGRLDHQKGVERLHGCIERIQAEGAPVDFRIVGSSLVDETGIDWSKAFAALGVTLEAPVYASDRLTALYLEADVLLLPSRWEGAPLVIPECQQVGCIPICANVGAIDELVNHESDGLLIDADGDAAVADAIARQVRRLVEDDDLRRRLAAAAIERGAGNTWETNFQPLLDWIDRAFKDVRSPKAAVREIAPN